MFIIYVMHTGFNTNVPYKGKMYHVQTEDGGARNPVLTTLLYHKGEILLSEKSSYADVLVDDDWKEKVMERMKEQHRGIIKKLMAGQLTGEKEDALASGEKKELTLEETIIEYIIGTEVS
jgi:hypothetical protein